MSTIICETSSLASVLEHVGTASWSFPLSPRVDRPVHTSEEPKPSFDELLDHLPYMAWSTNAEGTRLHYNQRWRDFTGHSATDEYGAMWAQGIHPEDFQTCFHQYWQSVRTRTEFEVEYRRKHAEGEYRWIVDRATPRFDRDGRFRGFLGCSLDVTERKRTEESVRELSGRLINAQEEERARIARELHDNICQRITMLCIDLELIKKSVKPEEAKLQSKLERLCKTTGDLAQGVRHLSHQLHSAMLDHVGLVPAARDLCSRIGEQHGIKINVQCGEVPHDLPKDVSLGLFRVLQECLNNIVKHSGADRASIQIEATGHTLRLSISDSGVGFNSGTHKPGLGLTSVRERVRLLGGHLDIVSRLMAGTIITAEVPMAGAAVSPTGKEKSQLDA